MHIDDFKLDGGLNENQIKLIIEKALELTEKTGIKVSHKGILNLLSNYDGVIINNHTVKFKKDLVMKTLDSIKYPLPDYVKNNWIISAGAQQT